MEIADVTLTKLQRRSRAAFLTQDDLDSQRRSAGRVPVALAPDDEVVVRAEDGEHFLATVVELTERAGEPTYLLSVGVRVPAQWARAQTHAHSADPSPAGGPDPKIEELFRMLNDLRNGAASLPSTAQQPSRVRYLR